MNIGDRITFPFGGKEKEGVVVKIFPKTVYLKSDFPRHPGKIVIRTIAELESKGSGEKKKSRAQKKRKKEPKKAEE
jgi:hypothetical protein